MAETYDRLPLRHEGSKDDAEAAEGTGAVDAHSAAATGPVQAEALKLSLPLCVSGRSSGLSSWMSKHAT